MISNIFITLFITLLSLIFPVHSAIETNRNSIQVSYNHGPVDESRYDIRNSLPKGYVMDGSEDYTDYIQQAINKYDRISFPGFRLLINDKGLRIWSNKSILFEKGSQLILKASEKGKYNIIEVRNVKNIELINPVIKGDRYNHIGLSGEWGMGIGIYSSSNIKIINAKVYDCWGDGIYLGTSGGTPNYNIQILNPYCKNNRRNGFSIISVDGLLLQSPYAGYTNGTPPMAGIDIEPDNPMNEVKNIKIINPKTEYNKGAGINLSLSKMYGKSDKKLNVEIKNHLDRKSNIGLRLSCYTKRKLGNEEVSGNIFIDRPTWIQNQKVPIQTALFQKNLILKINKPSIVNKENKLVPSQNLRSTLKSKGHINVQANSILSF